MDTPGQTAGHLKDTLKPETEICSSKLLKQLTSSKMGTMAHFYMVHFKEPA
jgi:hypothetical protein